MGYGWIGLPSDEIIYRKGLVLWSKVDHCSNELEKIIKNTMHLTYWSPNENPKDEDEEEDNSHQHHRLAYSMVLPFENALNKVNTINRIMKRGSKKR